MSRFDADLFERALRAIGKPAPKVEPLNTRDEAVEIVVELCKRFEGFISHPYLCPAGVPTIGYGSTFYLDGRRVQLSDPPISRETAERLLRRLVETVYLPAVLRQCPGLVLESPGRIGAIGDWTFNLGEGNLRISTLRKEINAGNWGQVPAQIRRWNKAGGKVYRGLDLRRAAEARLI